MVRNKTLKDFEEVIRKCVKCGVCQAHCPPYLVKKREGAVARGKIALAAAVLDGETGIEKRLQEDISLCLMCGSCVKKCPNKVPTDGIIGAMRREITDRNGLPVMAKLLAGTIGSARMKNTLSKGAAFLRPLWSRKIPQSSGLHLRFGLPGMENRTVPEPAFSNLFDRVPEFSEGQPGRPVVGFFAGCSITYIYPEIGEMMVDILVRMGCSVFLPKNQGCCGIPALSSGHGKLVEELADNNIEVFAGKKVDWIVTACGSCNGGIGEYYRTLEGADRSFTDKVVDFSVFLEKEGFLEKLLEQKRTADPVKVTYHDPCHLKTQGITREPRDLLRALPYVDFVEMEDADACCGLGGTFSLYHYDVSKAVGARKLRGLEESGAEYVATTCPGCVMQLQDTINHAGLKVRAVHILELLLRMAPD
ncbi:(Fe-S)-binding protein [Desulforhopalus singaporensis]|uniref:Glycolate oxidase iron-sulfur subunit n=1 Tax=Desulforhopalus singaporensis TaxID=91360 RepID=A0A1H0TXY3_9BACT|nr:(Fe-S)-binding protein [Desulforhopalus singaporensis]SDP58809.1 glycolate oxidase iron-sulfur subunit [Desulforhopalus singaporensis]